MTIFQSAAIVKMFLAHIDYSLKNNWIQNILSTEVTVGIY